LGVIWTDLWTEPLFRAGVLLKLFIIVIFVPDLQKELFIPFVINWLENPATLPWSSYILSNGDSSAFPYGLVMFISHLPTTLIGWITDNFLGIEYFKNVGFGVSLFLADIVLLLLLLQTFEDLYRELLIHYWLSPLVLFITYWHGQTDLIPIAIFFYSLTLIKRRKFALAGVVLACSITAKHSMAIGAPFILIYLLLRNGTHGELQKFLLFLIAGLLLLDVPFFTSDAFRIMVLESKEIDKLYWLSVSMGDNKMIYITPIAYLILLYSFWRIKKVNFDLLIAAMGVAFSVVILMTPSSPGWYLWLIPILAIHQSRYGLGAKILVTLFSLLFISFHLLHTSGANTILFSYDFVNLEVLKNYKTQSIHYTLMFGFGFIIAIQILREGVRGNNYYNLGRRPLVIGVSGGYNLVKRDIVKNLVFIFGEKSTVMISGNDYHNQGIKSSIWRILTHLDPRSSRIFDMVNDVRSLISGETIWAKSYNSKLGRFMTEKIKKGKNLVLVDGPHALYSQQLLGELDVKVFVEIDDSLESYINAKNNTKEKEKTIEQIKNDMNRYIKPQKYNSDIIFRLILINKEILKIDDLLDNNIRLRVSIKNGIYYQKLIRVLVGICGLQVNIKSIDEKGEVILEIDGDISSEDVNLAVSMLVPHMEEMLDMSVKFANGVHGIMQIITLMEIDEALKKRQAS